MTDRELVEGLKNQERAAVRHLVSCYQKKVIKTASYFLGSLEEAEDLSQEIFMEIMASIHKYRQDAAFSTWIYRITVNRALNRVKRNRREAIVARIGSFLHTVPGGKSRIADLPSDARLPLEEDEQRRLLYKAIGSLPENQRIAFILHKFEERSYKEIAGVMALSLASVESLIHRAKLNLQKSLLPHFSEYSKKNI
jgi:RNA polymerase sigma-70 factor (ECF subfamily)